MASQLYGETEQYQRACFLRKNSPKLENFTFLLVFQSDFFELVIAFSLWFLRVACSSNLWFFLLLSCRDEGAESAVNRKSPQRALPF